jgi:hypothetical protein
MSPTLLSRLPAPRCFCLQAGQSLHEWVAVGTVLHLIEGDVEVIAPPVWLAETMVRSSQRLGRGSVYTVSTRGWLTITASHAASLRVQPAAAPAANGIALCAKALRWLARAMAGRRHTSDTRARSPRESERA